MSSNSKGLGNSVSFRESPKFTNNFVLKTGFRPKV
jgi:hypothetical protein